VRIAVVGAGGVAGRAFVAAAGAAGHALVTQRVDLFDTDALARTIAGCDALVNLATAVPRPGGANDWSRNDRIRREGTLSVIAACGRAGVGVLAQQSVAMLHADADDRPQREGDRLVGYGVLQSAFDMEQLVRQAPIDVRVVRGGLFYGPGTGRENGWADEAAANGYCMPGDGQAWMSPLHVDDFARAVLTVLENGPSRAICIACDDTPLRWCELYAAAAARAGAQVRAGGPLRLRSFRVSNATLRALGWRPAHAALGCGVAQGSASAG
jgi:NADH dehydrogenase